MKTPTETRQAEFALAQEEAKKFLQLIANGDRKAFQALHRQYAALVYSTALSVLHSHEDAEDTTQEVFASVWAKAAYYQDHKGKVATWLLTMARNRAIDKTRGRERRAKLYENYQQDCLSLGKHSTNPDRAAERQDVVNQTRMAVSKLSPQQQLVLQMAFFEGLTQMEIAQRTGDPLGTVKARIRRGLGKLRQILKA